jgi:hypothetical protein
MQIIKLLNFPVVWISIYNIINEIIILYNDKKIIIDKFIINNKK